MKLDYKNEKICITWGTDMWFYISQTGLEVIQLLSCLTQLSEHEISSAQKKTEMLKNNDISRLKTLCIYSANKC